MILILILSLFLSTSTLFVTIKFLLQPENRASYFNSYTTYANFSLSRRMIDNANYITFISLLVWGYWFTSVIFVIIILLVSLTLCIYNKITIYVVKLLLFYASMIFKPLYKFRNITDIKSFFLIGNPTINIVSFLLNLYLWIRI